MEIGVLTFFESDNYGTVLQAYALQRFLETFDHHVTLLHFKRNINATSYHYKEQVRIYTLKQRIKNRIVMHATRKTRANKKLEFEKFRSEHLNISVTYYETGTKFLEDAKKYDLLISGGDQIWNPYHKSFSLNYMFDFLPEQYRRISYASSFGIDKIEDEKILKDMKAALEKYSNILVREASGVDIVEQMGLSAKQVLDPVFLITEHWKTFIEEKSPLKEKYGVIYALVDYNDESNEMIRDYAKNNKLTMVVFPDNRWNCASDYKKRFGLSPKDFLNYIAHSEIVFTNSFHGLAFAIIFRKPVVILEPFSKEANSKKNRLNDLLQRLKLDKRSDYSEVDNNFNKLIQNSRELLLQAIEEAEKRGKKDKGF